MTESERPRREANGQLSLPPLLLRCCGFHRIQRPIVSSLRARHKRPQERGVTGDGAEGRDSTKIILTRCCVATAAKSMPPTEQTQMQAQRQTHTNYCACLRFSSPPHQLLASLRGLRVLSLAVSSCPLSLPVSLPPCLCLLRAC